MNPAPKTVAELKQEILAYQGRPFIVNEMAVYHGVTWHRMKRIIDALVEAGELKRFRYGGSRFTFYQKDSAHG